MLIQPVRCFVALPASNALSRYSQRTVFRFNLAYLTSSFDVLVDVQCIYKKSDFSSTDSREHFTIKFESVKSKVSRKRILQK